jgi:hypothetical protein
MFFLDRHCSTSDLKSLWYKDLRSTQFEQKLPDIHNLVYLTSKDKAKITVKGSWFMDETTRHMMDLYGLNPNVLPFAFQFPRLPPGLTSPVFGITPKTKNSITKNNDSLNLKLQDFKQMYQKFASGLFDMHYPGLIPPGHPLHSRQNSIETLNAENSKLQKENMDMTS